jgi:hypothetical protein
MTDVEMKEQKSSPATEENKIEELDEPTDHFYGKFN